MSDDRGLVLGVHPLNGPSIIDALHPTSVACCLLPIDCIFASLFWVGMPPFKLLSVRPFRLALHFRFHCALANLPHLFATIAVTQSQTIFGVRFRKSIVYSVPIIERMLQAILDARTINDHVASITPHDGSTCRTGTPQLLVFLCTIANR